MVHNTFGEFIKDKRLARSISIRKMAEMLECSASYVSAVEQGRRNPYDKDRLEKLGQVLGLGQEDFNRMLTLAGKSKTVKSGDTVCVDLSDYIKENDFVSAALRTARDLNAGEKEWKKFVEDLYKRNCS